jgi:hypothetical protein
MRAASSTQHAILTSIQFGQPRLFLCAKPMPATSSARRPIPCSAMNSMGGLLPSRLAVASIPPSPIINVSAPTTCNNR